MKTPFGKWLTASVIAATAILDGGASQKQDAPPTKLPEPKLVTLHAEKIRTSQALAEIAKQTGIRVEAGTGLADESIPLNLQRMDFWRTLDVIAASANARVNLYPTSGRIVLDKRGVNYRLPPISYHGRFRLTVQKVTASRDLEIGDTDPRASSTNIALQIAWDTELLPLYLETRPHAVRFMDDTNKVVTIPDEGSSLAPVDGLIALGIDLHLPSLPRSVSSLRSLEGELSMIGPSKMLTFTFDLLDRLAKANPNDPERRMTQEGVTCHILKVTLDRERWTVQIALDYPPGLKQLDTNQSWVVNNEMTLESPDGKKRFASTNYVLEEVTPRRAVLSYHFRDRGGIMRGKPSGWRVTYRTPADLIEVPIKFKFKDIPLP
jgi:hypothetical protein